MNPEESFKMNEGKISPVWSFWRTIGISVLIVAIGNFFVQLLIMIIHVLAAMIRAGHVSLKADVIRYYSANLFKDSYIISETILVSDFLSVLLIFFFVQMKNRENMKGYLGFNSVKPLPFIFWQAAMIALYYSMNYIAAEKSLAEPKFMRVMRDMLKTESFAGLLLMLTAVVVAAPLFEEMMFRGFMYTGVIQSRLGVFGAIFIPAACWSLIHVQYEPIWIGIIFFMGVVFSLARYLTGSIYTVIAMHAVNNFLSFVEITRG